MRPSRPADANAEPSASTIGSRFSASLYVGMQTRTRGREELKTAAQAGRLRGLAGLGPKTEERVLKALSDGPAEAIPGGALLGRALPLVREAVDSLREHPAVDRVSEAGSVRRRVETVRDL